MEVRCGTADRARGARWYVSAVVLIALGLLVASCDGDGDAPGTPAASASATATSARTASATAAASNTVAAATETQVPVVETPASPQPAQPPDTAAPAQIIYRGNTFRRTVALTFDAGSDTGYTAEILRVLRAEGVAASFSITGLWAERNPELVVAITADGHRLINHSYDHSSFTGFSTNSPPKTIEERALQLSRTETTLYRLTQRSTHPYFRPPYGDLDETIARDVGAAGYDTIVMWSVDTLGWNRATADEIVQRSLERAEPGAIYVMHVGSQSQDAAALPRIIAGLRQQGYAFGTIDGVLAP